MKKIIAFAFFLAAFGLATAIAVRYPNPGGHVNDFAKLLFAGQAHKLEGELREYQKQTSIEIAVVTVSSLEGLSIEDYTIGLARSWGVGDRKKNNGVVLLVAPNERKVRIEVGYGLEPDLTDAESGRIIRENIIPLFKAGKMAEGVISGAGSIIAALGLTPYEAREAERLAKAEKERMLAEQRKADLLNFLLIGGAVLVVILIFAAAAFYLRKKALYRQKLKAMHAENARILDEICDQLAQIEKDRAPSQKILASLKNENPKEVWEELEKKINAISATSAEFENKHLNALNKYNRGEKYAEETADIIKQFYPTVAAASCMYGLLKSRSEEIAKARDATGAYSNSLPDLFAATEKTLNHPDVLDEARLTLRKARNEYCEANKLLCRPAKLVNWLLVYSLCSNASSLAKKASDLAVGDKKNAERARREGPELLKILPGLISNAERETSDSDVSSSAKQAVIDAKSQYVKAKSLANQVPANWTAIFAALTAAKNSLNAAIKKAKDDKDDAERERRRKRESATDSNIYVIGGLGSGGSGGGESFGGFGGGDFGGGGASGSW